MLRPSIGLGRGALCGRGGISAGQSEGGASRHLVCRSRRGRAQAGSRGGGGYPCFGAPGFLPGAGLGGWSPGSPPIHMPDGVSTTLTKRSDLVIQLHFHPTGKPEIEQGSVALGFTSQPPRRRLIDIPLGSRNIDIPPGDKAYKVTDHFTLPVDVEAIQIIPHAHYICKEMRGVAHLPDGSTRWLIKISRLGFQLAGAVSLLAAGASARRYAPRDGIHLRQLGCESAQSEPSAAARAMGAGFDRRNGGAAHQRGSLARIRLRGIGSVAMGQADAQRGRRIFHLARETLAIPQLAVGSSCTRLPAESTSIRRLPV